MLKMEKEMSAKELRYGQNVANKVYFVKVLDELGIQRKYMGYYLLIELMEVLVNQDKKITSFSQQVYPIIAEKYGKTACTVERNIRSLIEKNWSYDLMTKLNVYYVDGERPTCREFIYLVKNYILKQIM